ncbi:hypothetical protein [Roseospira goensis]|uniref:Uncharacterized protein n=1 Tax=Roseospira goensis TaxID=391922 RepID=A0A7W6S321_9PROT|nr:hypothetical protein [Roseospira goensis]MBB4287975.1 hypothetical protein [Roseospira goensis]
MSRRHRQRRPARSTITYAHLPGGGPEGRTCKSCAHFRTAGHRAGSGVCAEAGRQAGLALSALHPLWDGTRACRYWTGREDTAS